MADIKKLSELTDEETFSIATKAIDSLTDAGASEEDITLLVCIANNLMSWGAPWELYTGDKFRALSKSMQQSIADHLKQDVRTLQVSGAIITVPLARVEEIAGRIQGMPTLRYQTYAFNPNTAKIEKTQLVEAPIFSRTMIGAVVSKVKASQAKFRADIQSGALASESVIAFYNLNTTPFAQVTSDTLRSLGIQGDNLKVPAYTIDFATAGSIVNMNPKAMAIAPNGRSVFVRL